MQQQWGRGAGWDASCLDAGVRAWTVSLFLGSSDLYY